MAKTKPADSSGAVRAPADSVDGAARLRTPPSMNGGPGPTPRGGRSRLVPPVGCPLERHEWLAGVRGVLGIARVRRRARRALADHLGVRRTWLFSSGRAALTTALRVLSSASPARREVVVPAYTCYSVASAIVRAGLVVRLADYRPGTLEIEPASLASACGPTTLAIVATHLLGMPMDLRPFQEAATSSGARLIDEAAQALGARRGGRPCGAGGDLGILSFGRGKPLTTLGGGALVADATELVQRIEPEAARVALPGAGASTRAAIQAAIYTALLAPSLYWLPSRLPFLKIGQTEFDTTFPIAAMPAFKFGLLREMLQRLDAVNERRRQLAERWQLVLADLDGVGTVEPPEQSYATYLRFPVLLEESALRAPLVAALRAAGVSAGPLYPRPLHRVEELEGHCPDHGGSFPGAERLAASLLTLPTYPHVDVGVVTTARRAMESVLRGAGDPAMAAAPGASSSTSARHLAPLSAAAWRADVLRREALDRRLPSVTPAPSSPGRSS